MGLLKSGNGKNGILTVVLASLFLVSLGMISHNAFAMGAKPGSCTNEYDGPFTNATIIVGNQTYYPMKNSVSFQLTNDKGYLLTYTIQTPSQNSQGNSLPGQVFVGTNVNGYSNGVCEGTAYPNSNFTVSGNISHSNSISPQTSQYVLWGASGNSFSYTVNWVFSGPQTLVASSGNSQISLSWQNSSNNGYSPIINYKIYRSTSSGTETLLATLGNVDSYTDNSVINGQIYYYYITYVSNFGESSTSNEVHSIPNGNGVSSPPQSLHVTADNSRAILSWTAPSSNGGSPITNYNVYRGTSSGSEILLTMAGNVTSYNDTTVTNGQTYFYKVTAVNSVGESPQSNEASAAPISSPTSSSGVDAVTATIPVGSNPIGVAVNPNTNKIYVTNQHGYSVTVIDGKTNNVVTTIPGITYPNGIAVNPNTNMIYVAENFNPSVAVVNGSTNIVVQHIPVPYCCGGEYTDEIAVNPATNMVYVGFFGTEHLGNYAGGPGQIHVINASTNTVVKTLDLGQSPNGIAVNQNTNKIYVGVNECVYAYNPPVYCPYLIAIDGSTNSVASNIPMPSGLGFVDVNPNTNTIYASETSGKVAVINGSTNQLSAEIPVANVGGGLAVNPSTDKIYLGNYNNGTITVIDAASGKVLSTLAEGTSPHHVAVNPITDKIYVTNYLSNVVTVIDGNSSTSSHTVPSAPQNLQASAGNAQVTLSWSAPSNNGGSPITNYKILRGIYSNIENVLVETGNTTSFTDTGVSNGQVYYYKVTAVNSVGESALSKEADAVPSAPSPYPSAPTNLVATAVSSSQINLKWNPPAYNGGSPITNYQVYRYTNPSSQQGLANIGNVTSYNDTTVSSGVTYYYFVIASNSAQSSSPSNTASATTPGNIIASGIVLNNVQSTSGTTSTLNQITLSSFNAGTGSNKILLVGISANNNSPVSVTFNGVQLTQAIGSFYNNDAEFWYLKNPTSTGDIMVTMGGPTQAVVGAYSFSGVNQTAPIATHVAKHNTTPNSPNISITIKYANDLVLDLPSIYGGSTLGSPTCTQQWDVNMPNAITGASSSTLVQSPATVTCKWSASSADFWDDVAVELKAN